VPFPFVGGGGGGRWGGGVLGGCFFLSACGCRADQLGSYAIELFFLCGD